MAKRWIGRWVIAVSILHTMFGLVAFTPAIREMLDAGLWDSVGLNPMRRLAMWFLLGGGFMLVAGLAIDVCEHTGGTLRAIGWALLVITLITIILVPLSGAWLLLPPAIAMIWRGGRG